MPKKATVEDLSRYMAKRLPKGAKVLHPCGDLANPILRKKFDCDEVEVYRTRGAKLRVPRKDLLKADLLTFASSETVRQFAKSAGKAIRKVPAACIGPVTARTARKIGFRVAATADPHTIEGLVKAVRKALR